MTRPFACLLAAAVMLASAGAAAQSAVVAFSIGEATLLRDAGRSPLSAGTSVSAGDRIVTGADARAQLRFADGTVVAIAPSTELAVESAGAPAVLRLARGGVRAASPRVEEARGEVLRLTTPQSTLVARGSSSHVQVLICAPGGCRATPDAAPADPGLYAGVYDGSVAASASGTTASFGLREFFFVADGGAPRRLVAPPAFLAGATAGMAVTGEKQLAFDSVPEFALPRLSSLLETVRIPYQSTQDLAFGEPVTPPVAGIVGSDEATLEFVADVAAGHLRLDSFGRVIAIDTGSLTASLGSASLVDTGVNPTGGANLNWGRWEGPGSTIAQLLPNGSVVHNDGGNLHYVYGVVATDLPTAGIVEYALVGGTRPTDSGTGETGTLISGGRVAVNFNNALVSVNGLQVGFSNAVYTMSGTGSLVGSLFSSGGFGATGSCTGSACQQLVGANFAGFLAGPGAPGMGLDYYFNTRNGVIEGVGGYRRCVAPGAC